jgi:mono/diheme cytochrome c family protein
MSAFCHSPRASRRLLAAIVVAVAAPLLLVALAPAGTAGSSKTSAAAPKAVNVTIRDTRFALSRKAAPVGKVRFVVKNVGKSPHNFKVANRTTPTLKTGKTAALVVTFTRAGNYGYISTAKGDAARGLKGMFKVTPTPASSAGNPRAGRAVFIANCGTCHVLKAAGTRGTIGPNLDTKKSTFAALVKIVTNGKPGTAMTSFENTLTAEQIQDVSAFVFDATH